MPKNKRFKPSMATFRRGINRLGSIYQRLAVVIIPMSFGAGVFLARLSSTFADISNVIIPHFFFGLEYLAIAALLVILAPNVANLLHERKKSNGFSTLFLTIFVGFRGVAVLWSIIFSALIFGLPLFGGGSFENYTGLSEFKTILTSKFFIAAYIATSIGIIGHKEKSIEKYLNITLEKIEDSGKILEYTIPLILFMIGGYLFTLPQEVNNHMTQQTLLSEFSETLTTQETTLFGLNLSLTSASDIVIIYIIGAVLILITTHIYQFLRISALKKLITGFSIRKHTKDYYMNVYPLAWATSSESVSMPVNMNLIKKHYKRVKKTPRRLATGLGAYLNIEGTVQCVVVLAVLISVLLGYTPSIMSLLLALPIIVLLGFAVPGTPGELVIFAFPMMTLLQIPEAIAPLWLALYVSLQIGLPDSFRTSINVIGNGDWALLLNKVYKNRKSYRSTKS